MFKIFYDLANYKRRAMYAESEFGNAEYFYDEFSGEILIEGNSILLIRIDKNNLEYYIDIGENGLIYCVGLMLKKLNTSANYNDKDRYIPSLENINNTIVLIKTIYTMKELENR